jgi:hypothetical protein
MVYENGYQVPIDNAIGYNRGSTIKLKLFHSYYIGKAEIRCTTYHILACIY